jgi:hypothetical protein
MIVRRRGVFVSLGALAVVASCGGAPGPEGAADAGASANPVGTDGEAASLASATGMLAGPLAFPVQWVLMDPTEPASECGADAVASGGYAATAIVMFEDNESSLACADDAGLNRGATGRFILVEVATLQYVQETTDLASPPPPTQALTAGVYTIVNQGENDEALCAEPVSAPTAILEVEQFGLNDAQQIAVSGTVTIESIGPRSIVGTFNVMLGGPFGQTDGGQGQPLSGSFNAAMCP